MPGGLVPVLGSDFDVPGSAVHGVAGDQQVVGFLARGLHVQVDALVGVPHGVVVDPDVGGAVVVDARRVLRPGHAGAAAPLAVGGVGPGVHVVDGVAGDVAVAGLGRAGLPADGVQADVVGVVDHVAGGEEVGDVPVDRHRLALPGARPGHRVALDDQVLQGRGGGAARGDHRDAVAVHVAVAAHGLGRVVLVGGVGDVLDGVVDHVDVAARPAAQEAGRAVRDDRLVGVAGVAADRDVDPGRAVRGPVEGVVLHGQAVDLHAPGVHDADPAGVGEELVGVGVGGLHLAEVERGRRRPAPGRSPAARCSTCSTRGSGR